MVANPEKEKWIWRHTHFAFQNLPHMYNNPRQCDKNMKVAVNCTLKEQNGGLGINYYTHLQMTFNNDTMIIHWWVRKSFQQMVLGQMN